LGFKKLARKKMTTLDRLREAYVKKTATGNEKELLKLTKEAGSSKLLKPLLAAAVAGPAASIGYRALEQAYYGNLAERRFTQTIKEMPGLADYEKNKVRKHFNVLKEVAPRLASIPAVAGPWLMRTMQFSEEGLTPAQIKDVLEVEELRQSTTIKPESVGKPIGEYLGALGE
jgi:hypothetical protein